MSEVGNDMNFEASAKASEKENDHISISDECDEQGEGETQSDDAQTSLPRLRRKERVNYYEAQLRKQKKRTRNESI